MTISVKNEDGKAIVNIEGLIKSSSDAQAFKDAVESVADKSQEVVVNIMDSFAITSSIIGYLRKKVQVDNLHLKMIVHEARLYDLLEELNLIEHLNVKLS